MEIQAIDLERAQDLAARKKLIGAFRISNSDYHHPECPGVSSSHLKAMLKSPLHFQLEKAKVNEPTAAMRFGSAIHSLLLDGRPTFESTYCVAPAVDKRTKEGKGIWENFVAANTGKEILSADDYYAVLAMERAIKGHAIANTLISGMAEVAFFFIEPMTQILCKVKLDVLKPQLGMVVDLKTSEDASPEGFAKSVAQFGYWISASYYLDGVKLALEQSNQAGTIERIPDSFVFIVIEKKTNAIAVYTLEAEDLERGRIAYRRALSQLAECERQKAFPGYPAKIQTITLPAWAV